MEKSIGRGEIKGYEGNERKNRKKERKRQHASKRLILIHIFSICTNFSIIFCKYNWICSRILWVDLMVVEMCHWRRKCGFSVVSMCRLFWTIARMELADELDDNDGKRKTNKQKMIREILKWQRRRQQLNANGTWMLCSREMKILTQRKHENYLNKGKRTVENMLHCHAIHISYIYSIQYVIENNMYVYPIWKLDRPKIDLSFCHLQYTSLFFFEYPLLSFPICGNGNNGETINSNSNSHNAHFPLLHFSQ